MATASATLDRQLTATARRLSEAARQGRPLEPVLERNAPDVYRQLRSDRAQNSWLQIWGESRNFDEHAREVIVDPDIVRLLGKLAGVQTRTAVAHAGLLHTYGYLFSTLRTPYGYKRERWVSPVLDHAFGFAQPTLRANPSEGTLLTNVSYVLGRIAFRRDSRNAVSLRTLAGSVSREAVDYDYARLPIQRIVERVEISATRTRPSRTVSLRTDLVTVSPGGQNKKKNVVLLVYSVVESPGRARLITGFPIFGEAKEELIASSPSGTKVSVQARYNAYVAGLPARGLSGTRRIRTE